jgi:hypothetical protein
MALITLRNGKTVDIDLWRYLEMSDEELQDLEAMNIGFEAENPFHSSSLTNTRRFQKEALPEEEDEEEDLPIDDFDDTELLNRDDI